MNLRPFLSLVVGLGLGWGCSGYEKFDSEGDLRSTIARRLGPDGSAVGIPFELDPVAMAEFQRLHRPSPSENRRVDQVLDFVFSELRLHYALLPTRDATGTFEAREGNCLSFVNLFVALARSFRLNPFYVEVTDYQKWSYRDGQVLSQGHIVAGMFVAGNLKTYDFLPYRPKSYKTFRPIDDLTATAHYYNNLGAEALIADDLEQAATWLEIATRLAPNFIKAANNYGVLLTRQGQYDRAVEVYRRSLLAEPDDVAVLTNLAGLLSRRGAGEEAATLLARISGVNNTNPFFFLYQGDAALARGDHRQALQMMREALRRDAEIPEVQLGLVRTYFALGDLERARYHLERALKLDATSEEARRFAVMLGKAPS